LNGSPDWTRDERFWQAVRPLLFTPEQWSVATAEALEVLALLNLEPGARVLDLGCGTGRHALALADLGYAVTAVDGSEAYLRELRRRAHASGLPIRVERADLREYDGRRAFDAVLCLGSTFGLYRDDLANRRVAGRIREALSPGGGAIIEVIGREMLPAGFAETETVRDGRRTWTLHRSLQESGRWIEDRWDDGLGASFTTGMRVYSARQLEELLIDCGFERVELAGGLDGSPYSGDAFRLVAMAWS
jgi:SAM-dependent methyltransferase